MVPDDLNKCGAYIRLWYTDYRAVEESNCSAPYACMSALHESRTRNQLLFYTVVQKILGRRRKGSSHILGGNSSGGILIGLGKITT
jgi:hypothetical protein